MDEQKITDDKLLASVVIPDYPDKIMIAKARRPVFYVKEDSKVRGRTNIPKTYRNKDKYDFDEKGVLISKETGLPKLANPRTVGKPRYWVVNFQDVWNQNITRANRAMKVDKLKKIISPYIKKISKIKEFPVEINIEIHDIDCPVDISNRGAFYTKVIEDMLVTEGVLPDDTVDYVNCSGRIKFIRISKPEDKKMVINIFKSDNKPYGTS